MKAALAAEERHPRTTAARRSGTPVRSSAADELSESGADADRPPGALRRPREEPATGETRSLPLRRPRHARRGPRGARRRGEGAKVLAGGQSLLPLLSMRLAAPATWWTSTGCPASPPRAPPADGVTVGALVRHARSDDAAAAAVQPLLARATANVAHPAIRNRGTDGRLHRARRPPGEMTAVLALTGGSVTWPRRAAVRPSAGDFFVGPMETSVHGPASRRRAFFPALPAAHRHGVRRGRPAGRATTRCAALGVDRHAGRRPGSPACAPPTCRWAWSPRCTT